jgi:hypothetical protein
MASQLANTARTVVAFGADPTPFQIPYRFYSNGQSGHRHVTTSCPGFRYQCRAVEHTFTLLELKHLCEPCTSSILHPSTRDALDDAARFEREIMLPLAALRDEFDTVEAFWLLAECDRLSATVRTLRDHEILAGYIPACEARITKIRTAATAVAESGRDDLVRIAALDRTFRNADPGTTVKDILGQHGDDTLYRWLRDQWGANLALTGSTQSASRRIIEAVGRLVPSGVTQFRFTVPTAPHPGELMDTYLARAWRCEVAGLVSAITHRWADEYRSARNAMAPFVMALDIQETPSGLFASFLAAYTNARSNQRYVVVAPQVVITWISHNASGLRRVPEIVAIPGDFDAEIRAVTETAASLWDPATPGSSFERFGTAFTAAACL